MERVDGAGGGGVGGWRAAVSVYADRRVLAVLVLGFASGLPLLLTYSTLSAWLATAGIERATVGAFVLVGLPYSLKLLWAPLLDRLPPPLRLGRLGRRRGWGIAIQVALIAATLALGLCDPRADLGAMAALALLVAFLSASQDIVIDAYRVEILDLPQQGAGAAMVQAGYRIAMLVSGAGALFVASRWGWTAAYHAMAGLLAAGLLVFLFGREPDIAKAGIAKPRGGGRLAGWLRAAYAAPFAEFARRPFWPVIVLAVVGYKLGEAMAGAMATPLYVDLGYSLDEIAAVSKIFGFFATLAGGFLGGALVARAGILPALLLAGMLQSAGNLFYVVQAQAGHQVAYLALCVAAENLTGGMAGVALVAYLSGLCNTAYTATQYALLSSLASVGRTLIASAGGLLAQRLGWVDFFLLTTVATLPALALLVWLSRLTPSAPAAPAETP